MTIVMIIIIINHNKVIRANNKVIKRIVQVYNDHNVLSSGFVMSYDSYRCKNARLYILKIILSSTFSTNNI